MNDRVSRGEDEFYLNSCEEDAVSHDSIDVKVRVEHICKIIQLPHAQRQFWFMRLTPRGQCTIVIHLSIHSPNCGIQPSWRV